MNRESYTCWRAPANRRANPHKAKGPELVGAFFSVRRERGLEPAAAEVEAINQLAADRLHLFFRVLEADSGRQDRHEGSAGPGERRIFRAIVRVAILGLPEQSRDKVEAVFV